MENLNTEEIILPYRIKQLIDIICFDNMHHFVSDWDGLNIQIPKAYQKFIIPMCSKKCYHK